MLITGFGRAVGDGLGEGVGFAVGDGLGKADMTGVELGLVTTAPEPVPQAARKITASGAILRMPR